MSYAPQDPFGNMHITIILECPWLRDRLQRNIAVSAGISQCLRPLNRYRDLPPEFGVIAQHAASEAQKQRQERSALVHRIAEEILQTIESTDPQHGYSPAHHKKE